MTGYPNREHENADKAATRRALAALSEIGNELHVLRRRIEIGTVYGDDTNILYDKVRGLTVNISVLEALRDVREWNAADEAEKAEPRMVHMHDAEGAIIAVDARDNIPRAPR